MAVCETSAELREFAPLLLGGRVWRRQHNQLARQRHTHHSGKFFPSQTHLLAPKLSLLLPRSRNSSHARRTDLPRARRLRRRANALHHSLYV